MSGDAPARPATAPRPQRSRAEKSTARRAAILEAALDEFCEKGFAATRVEDVAARAGVAKTTAERNRVRRSIGGPDICGLRGKPRPL
jgi:Bacterial regulatory proteins, tetR family